MRDCQKTYKQLPAYLSGELKNDDRERIEAHLNICSRCRKEMASLSAVMDVAESQAPDFEKAISSLDNFSLPSFTWFSILERSNKWAKIIGVLKSSFMASEHNWSNFFTSTVDSFDTGRLSIR